LEAHPNLVWGERETLGGEEKQKKKGLKMAYRKEGRRSWRKVIWREKTLESREWGYQKDEGHKTTHERTGKIGGERRG